MSSLDEVRQLRAQQYHSKSPEEREKDYELAKKNQEESTRRQKEYQKAMESKQRQAGLAGFHLNPGTMGESRGIGATHATLGRPLTTAEKAEELRKYRENKDWNLKRKWYNEATAGKPKQRESRISTMSYSAGCCSCCGERKK